MSVNLPKELIQNGTVAHIAIMTIFIIIVFYIVITVLIPWIPHFLVSLWISIFLPERQSYQQRDRVKRRAVSLLLLLAHRGPQADRQKATPRSEAGAAPSQTLRGSGSESQ
jgi:hypothetical protein